MLLPSMSTEQIVLFLLLLAVPILPNLWSIRHAFYRDFPSPTEKMIWLGLAVFVPVLGGVAYIIWGRKRGQKPV